MVCDSLAIWGIGCVANAETWEEEDVDLFCRSELSSIAWAGRVKIFVNSGSGVAAVVGRRCPRVAVVSFGFSIEGAETRRPRLAGVGVTVDAGGFMTESCDESLVAEASADV